MNSRSAWGWVEQGLVGVPSRRNNLEQAGAGNYHPAWRERTGVSEAAVKTFLPGEPGSLAGVGVVLGFVMALLDYWKLAAVGSSRSLPELAACDCSI